MMGIPNRLSLKRLLAIAAVALPISSMGVTTPANAETKFILGNVTNEKHIQNVASFAFIDKLKELAGDSIKVEHHPGGDLGDWVGQFEQTMQGSIEMTQTWNASQFDKRLDLATLGYTSGNWNDCVELYQPGSKMAGFWNKVFSDLNMHVVGILPDGMYGIAVRKGLDAPKKFPEDARGFKLRVPPIKIGITRFEALGFSAVPMPYSELHSALQLGTVDGAAFQDSSSVASLADVYGHYIRTNDICGYSFWLANKKWWNELSENDRGNIEKAANHAVNVAWKEFETIDKNAIKGMKAAGVQVHDLTDEELAAAKKIVYSVEWPWAEKHVGAETFDDIRKATGISE